MTAVGTVSAGALEQGADDRTADIPSIVKRRDEEEHGHCRTKDTILEIYDEMAQVTAAKEADRAKWSHARYKGSTNLQRTLGETVVAEIRSRSKAADEWPLLQAFIGWLGRHFSDKIRSISIHYHP